MKINRFILYKCTLNFHCRYLKSQSQVLEATPVVVNEIESQGSIDLPPADQDDLLNLLVGDPLQVFLVISRCLGDLKQVSDRLNDAADDDDVGSKGFSPRASRSMSLKVVLVVLVVMH